MPIINTYFDSLNSADTSADDTVFLSGDLGLGYLGNNSIWGSEMSGLASAFSTVGAPGGPNSELMTSVARTLGSVYNSHLGQFVTLLSVVEVPNLWSVDFEQGTYTYAEAGYVPPIPTPLPAGAWLFFSGLLGFVGFRKVAH